MKRYITPATNVLRIHPERLLQDSMTVDSSSKVRNTDDIGFVKEDNRQDGSLWDGDWNN